METKINDILADYEITAPQRVVEKTACEVMNKYLDMELTTDDIRYQQGTLWVDTTPLIRSHIHLNKQTIKEKISQQLDNRDISNLH